jgi:hypothetical protein
MHDKNQSLKISAKQYKAFIYSYLYVHAARLRYRGLGINPAIFTWLRGSYVVPVLTNY